MKTLKEAYESVGETIQVGDIIDRWAWRQIVQSVDGWYFTDKTTDSDMCYLAEKIEGSWIKHIERNGKQIYPKRELESEKIMQEFRSCHSTILSDLINRLIDAKIKEAKK